MNIPGDYSAVLGEMIDYEQKLHLIYSMLATKFSQHQDFWRDIASDENTHALMLESVVSSYNENKESFVKNREFNSEDIRDNLSKARAFAEQLQTDNITLENAFKFALEAESSIVERNIFACCDDDPDEMKQIFRVLHDQSFDHHAKIRKHYTMLFGHKNT